MEHLVADCMAGEGFEYFPTAFAELPSPRRYGLDDRERAEASGYDVPVAGVRPNETRTARHLVSLAPSKRAAWQRALHGAPDSGMEMEIPDVGRARAPGGCLRRAEVRLYRDPLRHTANYFQLTQLIVQARAAADADVRVARALSRWRDCLRAGGYEATRRPPDMAALARTLTRSEHLKMSIADVACKEEVRLVEVWSSIESDMQRRLARKNQALLHEWWEHTRALVAEAQAVLRERP